jgi:hypothetical protein
MECNLAGMGLVEWVRTLTLQVSASLVMAAGSGPGYFERGLAGF